MPPRRIINDEIEFNTAYGKLAAKTWYEEEDDSKRILCLHGWMDNAGSFDNVIPLIDTSKQNMYFVGLDMPGHGKSSQLPPGASYHDLAIVMEIRRCLLEMNWVKPLKVAGSEDQDSLNSSMDKDDDDYVEKKFTIIGHSLGAGLGIFYAGLFPREVEKIIVFDFLKSPTYPMANLYQRTASTIDKFIDTVPSIPASDSPLSNRSMNNNSNSGLTKTHDKGSVVVSQEAAIIATIEAHKSLGLLSREEATCLLRRSTVPVSHPPNSVLYCRDLRLQSMLNHRDHVYSNHLMFSMAKCEIVSILSRSGLSTHEEFMDNKDIVKEVYRDNCKALHLEYVDGDHYAHMNNSKQVAEVINKYL